MRAQHLLTIGSIEPLDVCVLIRPPGWMSTTPGVCKSELSSARMITGDSGLCDPVGSGNPLIHLIQSHCGRLA